jgi:lambda repressor-like predicted transcriptional regulator
MEINNNTITEGILSALKQSGESKQWLSKKLGMSEPTLYSRINNNNFSINEINQIGEFLNISPTKLIKESMPTPPQVIDYNEYIEAGLQVIPLEYDEEINNFVHHVQWKADTDNGKNPITKELLAKWLNMQGRISKQTKRPIVFNAMALLCVGDVYSLDFDAKNSPGGISKYGEWSNYVGYVDPDIINGMPVEWTKSEGHHGYFKYKGKLESGVYAANPLDADGRKGEMIALRGGGLLTYCYPSPMYREIHSSLLEMNYLSTNQVKTMLEIASTLNLDNHISDTTFKEPIRYPAIYEEKFRIFDKDCASNTIPDIIIGLGAKFIEDSCFTKDKTKVIYSKYLRPGKVITKQNENEYSLKFFHKSNRLVNFSKSWDLFPAFDDKPTRDYVITPTLAIYYTSDRDWEATMKRIEELGEVQGLDLTTNDFVNGKWWYYGKNAQGKEMCSMSMANFEKWLNDYGFAWYNKGLVHAKDCIIKQVDTVFVRKAVKDYILPLEKIDFAMYDYLIRQVNKDIVPCFSALKTISESDILRDTKEYCYIVFRNRVVVISKGRIDHKKLPELNKFVWEETVKQHDIDIFSELPETKDIPFADFCYKAAGGKEDNLFSLMSCIGYLIHEYKVQSDSFAVIFAEDSIEAREGGGRGKNLVTKGVGHIRSTITMNGKTFNPAGDFAWQRVTPDTRVVCIDDLTKKSQFEQYNSIITEGMAVNQKGKQEIWLSHAYSPKIVFTTNYTIDNEAVFEKRRQKTVLFSDYFSLTRTPSSEYGHTFFDDWNKIQWDGFYNFMFYCVSIFLENRIIEVSVTDNYKQKAISSKYSAEFWEWAESKNKSWIADYCKFEEEYNQFIVFSGHDRVKYSSKMLSNAIKSYATMIELEYDKKRAGGLDNKLMFKLIKKQK